MSEPLFITPEGTDRLIGLALDGLASPHTRRAYQAALDEFLTLSQGQQPSELCKALVNRYKSMLVEKELAPATINLRLAAVRRLAQEAADNGLVDGSVASAISKVHGGNARLPTLRGRSAWGWRLDIQIGRASCRERV